MPYSLQSLRRKAWTVFKKEVTYIEVQKLRGNHTAECDYDSVDGITHIRVDALRAPLDEAVAHEILHYLLDEALEEYFDQNLAETIIRKLEKQFFTGMSPKTYQRWRQALVDRTIILKE